MTAITVDTKALHAFTSSTLLPPSTTFPESHIQLLDDFFRAVDDIPPNPTATEKFESIFAHNGTWKTPTQAFYNRDQLVQSGSTWEFGRTLKSIRHWVTKVYALDKECNDLMILGKIKGETLEGHKADVVFSAKVDVVVDDQRKARLMFFQGWSSQV